MGAYWVSIKFRIILATAFATLVILLPGVLYTVATTDDYQHDGELTLPALKSSVTVRRDALGIPYIQAKTLDDALTAQGFVIAQDRLFQMELFKQMANGRLAEFIGDKGLQSDRLVRLLDLRSLAKRQVAILSEAERNHLQRYVNGINAYVNDHEDNHPLVFGLMGAVPQPWTLNDVVAIQFFQIWSSSANWQQELLTQELIDSLGSRLAAGLSPISINPDDPIVKATQIKRFEGNPQISLNLSYDDSLMSDQRYRHAMGSNAWASGSRKSANGAPILVNDPHIDVRHLPGFWYPIGLITPQFRAVGAAAPGVPGIGVGRTNYIAWGATNGYSDMIDLYIEQLDPDNPANYLEGDDSFAFREREEAIKIKDPQAPGGYRIQKMRVRQTHRGPVISDHGMSIGKFLHLLR